MLFLQKIVCIKENLMHTYMHARASQKASTHKNAFFSIFLVGTHQSTGLNKTNVMMIKTINMNSKYKFLLFQEPLNSQNTPKLPVSLII